MPSGTNDRPVESGKGQSAFEVQSGDGTRIVDFYSHFSCLEILDFLEDTSGQRPHFFRSLFANTPTLIDVQARLNLMDRFSIRRSVLIPLPWIETAPTVHADPAQCLRAAASMNDRLAAVAARRPDRFSAVALLPTTNAEIMLAEFERAVTQLGMVGGCFVVGPTVKPPDHPDYETLYRKATDMDVPLWIHPSRPPTVPDYNDETLSRYQIWQCLAWLQDTSAAMVRIVFAGVFDRYPDLKLIVHHHGALIPLFAERMQYAWDYFEQNTGDRQPTGISRPYIDHFRRFHCDTATEGVSPRLLEAAAEFFGIDRIRFGSDSPMDASAGSHFTRDAMESVQGMQIPASEREQILSGNANRLLKLGADGTHAPSAT